ncbi:MAG: carboxypeptidase regulatory-like domain-containing protein [Acidobacteriota bacterium]
MRAVAKVATLAIVLALGLQAQMAIPSRVVGNVTDPQAALIPGADVLLRNVDTGIEMKSKTGENGEYVFPNVIPGRYRVTVTSPGFKRAQSQVSQLESGATMRLNIIMEIGEVTEQVTVEAAAPLVHTDDADVNTVLANKMVQDIPIIGRNFLNYASVMPQFNSGTGDDSRAAWGLASSSMPNGKVMNLGGTEYGVGYYVDGVNNSDNWVEGPTTNVNMDAVQEVKADVVNYSAEYGRDVGQLSIVTKSGTNALHGTVYDYRQVNGLNARAPYDKFLDPERGRDGWHQDQYGFTVGGPVFIPKVFDGRNKAFFFASWERLRRRGQSTFFAYTPTEAERAGDFSQWLERYPGDPSMVIYDPFSFNVDTQERTPYPNNVISNVNQRAAAYLSHFPMPNYTSPISSEISNYRGSGATGVNNDNFAGRFDYWLGEKDRIYFKYTRDTGSRINKAGLIPEMTLGNGAVHKTQDFSGHWIHTFSPTLNNEAVIGYMRGRNLSEDPAVIDRLMSVDWYTSLFENITTPGAGLTSFDKSQLKVDSDSIYALWLGGSFGSLSLGPNEYWYQVVPQLQFADHLTKIWGRHTLKGGFTYFRRDERDNDIIRWVGIWGGYTGRGPDANDGSGWNYLAEFMTGAVTEMTQRTYLKNNEDASLFFRMPEYGAYFNDTIQVNSKLTMNVGLRYDIAPQGFSVNNYWGVLDQSYPGWRLAMPGLTPGVKNPPFPSDKNNFAPRFGFAYRLNDKTVLRGGYGLFYETGRYKFIDQMFFNAPGYGGSYYSSADYAGMNGMDPNEAYFTLDNSFPAAQAINKGDWPIPLGDKGGLLSPRQDTTTIDALTPINPYMHRYSFDIQRTLGKDAMVSIGYAGSRGRDLTRGSDLNLPPEGTYRNSNDFQMARPLCRENAEWCDRFGSVMAIHHDGYNDYNAMVLKFEKRYSNGLALSAHWTWSKMTDITFNNNGYGNTSEIGGQWHLDWSHAESDANHPHRVVAVISYELPFAKDLKGWKKWLLDGWQLNAIPTFESGRAMTVYNGDTSSRDYMGDVPTRTCNGNLSGGDRTFWRYFDTSCFVNPADSNGDGIADHRGNAGRNIIRGPGINNWDASVFKKLYIAEGKSLDFRWEMFNAFNHTQWSWVGTVNDVATNPFTEFGRVTGGRPGREIQFGMKFMF